MKFFTSLLNQEGFLKTLFESIPCGVLVVDVNQRVKAVNNLMESTFGISKGKVINKKSGEVLKCIHSFESPEGCGFADACQSCEVRNTALEALAGKKIYRNKAKVQVLIDGNIREMLLFTSAAPLEHEGERFAVMILEDITELNNLRRRLDTKQSFAGIVGRNTKMNELFDTIREVAAVNVPVLIQGESGTGKELVATAIHNESIRSNKPFVPVNCGALPEGVLESELFGHVKGAFTGAIRDKKGRFEIANKGTLFLDEVAELTKFMQVKLLRVLQEGTIERVGDEKIISVDVRLISATNRDLKSEVEKGNFREDLYYRVNVVPIHLHPLREKKSDIPLLVEHFLNNAREEGQETPGLSPDALAIIKDYTWPGNIRELQSALRFALMKSQGLLIQPEHLPLELKEWKHERSAPGPSRKLNLQSVRTALIQSGGNKAKAARLLGVGRATLYRFLADFPDVS